MLSTVVAQPSLELLPISLRLAPTGERVFVDSAGRMRHFRGANAVVKGYPWVPSTTEFSRDLSLVDRDFVHMREMGMTMLRLGAMWPGIEPERGMYNETYLAELSKIVKNAAKHGIYTLLDGHQDLFSERFCGEGVPAWAVVSDESHPLLGGYPAPFGRPFDEFYTGRDGGRYPTRKECREGGKGFLGGTGHDPWNQVAAEASAAWEGFWANTNGTNDAWAAMWAHVAQHFRGDASILGLELLNEPFAGDPFHHPLIFLPPPARHNADHTRLQPGYDRANAAIRAVDDERLLFFAGVTWDDFGPGFTSAPGGDEYANRSVLAFHYYAGIQPFGPRVQMSAQLRGARRLGTGLFVTETNNNNDTRAAMDEHLLSWAAWGSTGGFKPFCRESNETRVGQSQAGVFGSCKYFMGSGSDCCFNQTFSVHGTYATAVAGNTTKQHFNPRNGTYRLEYVIDPFIELPTEIRLTPWRYPKGFSIAVDPPWAATATYDPGVDNVVVHVRPQQQARHGLPVAVTLTAPMYIDTTVDSDAALHEKER